MARMTHRECRAVVVRAPGERATVEEIRIEPPAAGEVCVRVLATGVCHTDLHAQQGHFGREFPYLLGHEATGVVEGVGEGVTTPRVGDTVTLSWRAPCGACRFCTSGRPSHCARPLTAGKRMFTRDGAPLGRVLGLGTFSTHTVVAAEQAIVLDADLAPTATCLIGCAVATGVGAVLHAARVAPGESVAVMGCGAVGLSVVQGARLAKAGRIVAIDRVAGRLAWARRFGATDTVDATSGDAARAVRELTGGGVDHAFEAVGVPETVEQALQCCGLGGALTLIGGPRPDARVTLPYAKLFYGRHIVRATFYGDCLPSRDFPKLAAWYRGGSLDIDGMVTARIGLEDVDSAFAALKSGDGVRSVIVF
jgi:S-(hydroxymethyl)mycothiol dehydrogenase